MREVDAGELGTFLQGNREALGDVRSLSLLSPSDLEEGVMGLVWPGIPRIGLGIGQWDIRERSPERHDVLLLCNVMMAVRDPAPVFGNLLSSCRRLVVLDNCIAYRGGGGRELPDPSLVPDETEYDTMRYTMPPEMTALLPTAFDLNALRDRLLAFRAYHPFPGNGTVCFIGLWRGML